ncbi:hypothetical protein GDO81_020178 [Engystomops pustulosus]|uniref:Thrombospondin-like N-terminal domain-containing protein n=1 Tax=Engystomops pustulosus TaxID=76066 RepID=A0AAV6YSL6_ENGPU|nr:hypothetical protein GDO81_020178 [Engystomops pustulosus]
MLQRNLFWLSVFISFCASLHAQDEEKEDETTFDLFEISNINKKTIGVKLFRGQDSHSPAYRFLRFDHIPPVRFEKMKQIMDLMQINEGFILTASMRQDKLNRGTIISIEGPGISNRLFELVSNGRANTLDLIYWVDGTQNVISLEDVDLSDSQWKNITVQLTGENFNLYVGCDLMDNFRLEETFYEHLSGVNNKMYLAKGSIRENHFRVRHFSVF